MAIAHCSGDAFARFNAVPHYAYLKLKMPGPRGVITVNGNTERSLRTEEHTTALAAEAQSSLLRQTANSAIKTPDTFKRIRSTLQQDRQALQSSPSNSASVLVPVNRRNLCRAYIITHSRYHGHRWRHDYGTAHNAAQPPQDPYIFNIFFLSGPYSLKALSDRLIIGPVTGRKHQGSKKL